MTTFAFDLLARGLGLHAVHTSQTIEPGVYGGIVGDGRHAGPEGESIAGGAYS